MFRSQKELINNSLQHITDSYNQIQKVQELLKEAGLYHFCSAFARINDDLSIQAKDLTDLNK